MKTYVGSRSDRGCSVSILDGSLLPKPLPMRLDVFRHSPSGFEWGYGGSGPAQLALAILCDHLGNAGRATRAHQKFKFDVIGKLPAEGWSMSGDFINTWLADNWNETKAG